MYVVVAYDNIDDRRRGRVARRLVYYLNRVQKSVFEGELPPSQYESMIKELIDLIDHSQDRVRVYHLCRLCRKNISVFGVLEGYPRWDEDEVV